MDARQLGVHCMPLFPYNTTTRAYPRGLGLMRKLYQRKRRWTPHHNLLEITVHTIQQLMLHRCINQRAQDCMYLLTPQLATLWAISRFLSKNRSKAMCIWQSRCTHFTHGVKYSCCIQHTFVKRPAHITWSWTVGCDSKRWTSAKYAYSLPVAI